MRSGMPPEIMGGEGRCALTQLEICQALNSFSKDGFLVGTGAGAKSNIDDLMFENAGAQIVPPEAVWKNADAIFKVKQPLPKEIEYLRSEPVYIEFFHLPGDPPLKAEVVKRNLKIIAYENLILENGRRPILAAMSERAAIFSVTLGVEVLRIKKHILVDDIKALVIGHRGVLGQKAYYMLQNMGAKVIGIDARECNGKYYGSGIDHWIKQVDLVICGAAAPNKPAPKLVFLQDLEESKEDSVVIVDPAIDEGGQCDFSRKTSHDEPTIEIITPRNNKKITYCGIPNMPGGVGPSSTPRLAKEVAEHVFPLLKEINEKGWGKAVRENPILERASQY